LAILFKKSSYFRGGLGRNLIKFRGVFCGCNLKNTKSNFIFNVILSLNRYFQEYKKKKDV